MKTLMLAVTAAILLVGSGAFGQQYPLAGDAAGDARSDAATAPTGEAQRSGAEFDHVRAYAPAQPANRPPLPVAMEGDAPIWVLPTEIEEGRIGLLPDVWFPPSFIPGYTPQS